MTDDEENAILVVAGARALFGAVLALDVASVRGVEPLIVFPGADPFDLMERRGPDPVPEPSYDYSRRRRCGHWAGGRPSSFGAYKGSKAAKKASRPKSRRKRSRRARK